MLVAAAALLLITLFSTWHLEAPVWKDSSLPMLFHGLDEAALPPPFQGPKMTQADLDLVARHLAIELRQDGSGRTRLVPTERGRVGVR